MENNKIPRENLEMSEFVKNNQHLFTTMGIFGAISLYLDRILDSQDISESEQTAMIVCISATLFLFVYFSLLILSQFFRDRSIVDFFGDIQNFECFIFIFPFYILVIFLFAYITTKFSIVLIYFIFLCTIFVFLKLASVKTLNIEQVLIFTAIILELALSIMACDYLKGSFSLHSQILIPLAVGTLYSLIIIYLVYLKLKYLNSINSRKQ